jgi:DNA-binding HxlR family transcriptional regulator
MPPKTSRRAPRGDLAKVLRSPHHLRIIGLLRREGSLGFNAIQETLSLNPAQVDRSLKLLTSGLWVVPETKRSGGTGPVRVRYRLGDRGRALAAAWDAFRAEMESRRRALGDATVREAVDLLA